MLLREPRHILETLWLLRSLLCTGRHAGIAADRPTLLQCMRGHLAWHQGRRQHCMLPCAARFVALFKFWLPVCLLRQWRSTKGPRMERSLPVPPCFARHAVFWLPVCLLCSRQCTRGGVSIANCLPALLHGPHQFWLHMCPIMLACSGASNANCLYCAAARGTRVSWQPLCLFGWRHTGNVLCLRCTALCGALCFACVPVRPVE